MAGNVRGVYAEGAPEQHFEYGPRTTAAYPVSKVTGDPLGRALREENQYDQGTGLLLSHTDPYGRTTNYFYTEAGESYYMTREGVWTGYMRSTTPWGSIVRTDTFLGGTSGPSSRTFSDGVGNILRKDTAGGAYLLDRVVTPEQGRDCSTIPDHVSVKRPSDLYYTVSLNRIRRVMVSRFGT